MQHCQPALPRPPPLQEAAQHYSSSLDLDPSSHVVWANRAAARLRLQDFKGAVADARRSSNIERSYVKAWYRCAAGAQPGPLQLLCIHSAAVPCFRL
jgi:hypothetical protein